MKLLGILVLFLYSHSWASLDQRNLPSHLDAIANPSPLDADYIQNNKQHKVIVAVIDSGVDYVHPDLVQNLHFDLDKHGKPIGLGYDYAGVDAWPHPYMVNNGVELYIDLYTGFYQKALKDYPHLSEKLSAVRAFQAEHESGLGHGTHVAGIVADAEHEIGIVPYRTGPMYGWPEVKKNEVNDYAFAAALDAHKRAYEKGIRIINISMTFKDDPIQGYSLPNYESYRQQYEDFVKAHPDLLIVAAAGNHGLDIGKQYKTQFPCGLQLPNILCVGYTDKNGKLNKTSNTYSGSNQIVYANGTDVLSTYPLGFCDPNMDLSSIVRSVSVYSRDSGLEATIFGKVLDLGCKDIQPYAKQSGSSMAAPYVTRLAAKIKIAKSDATPTEIISILKELALVSKEGLYSF